jgi:hypothetical protein
MFTPNDLPESIRAVEMFYIFIQRENKRNKSSILIISTIRCAPSFFFFWVCQFLFITFMLGKCDAQLDSNNE